VLKKIEEKLTVDLSKLFRKCFSSSANTYISLEIFAFIIAIITKIWTTSA